MNNCGRSLRWLSKFYYYNFIFCFDCKLIGIRCFVGEKKKKTWKIELKIVFLDDTQLRGDSLW
jgi:hypothetical protein